MVGDLTRVAPRVPGVSPFVPELGKPSIGVAIAGVSEYPDSLTDASSMRRPRFAERCETRTL